MGVASDISRRQTGSSGSYNLSVPCPQRSLSLRCGMSLLDEGPDLEEKVQGLSGCRESWM